MNKEEMTKEIQKLNDSINQSNLAKISALLKLEKLQQENKSLRGEIKVHSGKSHNRYKAIKVLEKHLTKLQQEKEELIKDLKQFLNEWDEDDYVSKSIKLILSKLKESDKDVS